MNEDYSNRELDRMFGEIMTTLKNIEIQTTKTNGRVLKLEDEVRGIQLWKTSVIAKITGIVSSITIGWVVFKEIILK